MHWRTTSSPPWCCSPSCSASRWSASNSASVCSTSCTCSRTRSRAPPVSSRASPPMACLRLPRTRRARCICEQLNRLQIYLVAYVAVALLVSLWVLPGLVAALTPIRARDILRESHDSLLTAFIAGDLFIVLPGLTQASRTLLDRLSPGDRGAGPAHRRDRAGLVQLPAHRQAALAELRALRRMVRGRAVPVSAYPQLALAGLVSFFGSLNVAVPFLLDLFRIPADTFQLFLATGVVNSRVGSLVAAVHTMTVALLATCAITGRLRWRRGPVLSIPRRHRGARHPASSAARGCSSPRPSHRTTQRTRCWRRCSCSAHRSRSTVARRDRRRPPPSLPPLETIRARGVLRVGYFPDALPFAFFNRAGDLVGFDVELAHDLARDLGVSAGLRACRSRHDGGAARRR